MSTPAATTRDASPRHLPALDGLRGLAALAVLLGHMPEFGFADWGGAGIKDYGVFLFFSLSGFLMGHLYLRRPWTPATAWSFAVARIARIVPIYFLVVLVSFVVFQAIDHRFVYDVGVRQLVRLLTFNGSVSVFWSVGPEFQFYAVFILLWWMWDRPALRFWSIAAAVATGAIGVVFNARLPGIVFLSKAHIFLLGVAAAVALRVLWPHRRAALLRPTLQFLAVASLVALAVPNPIAARLDHALTTPFDPKMAAFYGDPWIALWAALVVLALAWEGRLVDVIFANRPLVWLGEISFSLYLLHDTVLWLLETFHTRAAIGLPAASVLAIVLCLLAAYASNRMIEAPTRHRLRAVLGGLSGAAIRRRRPVAAPTPDEPLRPII